MNPPDREARFGIDRAGQRHARLANRRASECPRQPSSRKGFTLIELLVVLAIIAVLAGLLLPALGKAKARGQSAVCFNNIHQLQLAWFMYPDDHGDLLAPNPVVLSGGVYRSMPGSWVVGNAQLDTSPSNLAAGVLWPYTGAAAAYKCPADKSTVDQQGKRVPRNRTYSLHFALHSCGPVFDAFPPQSRYAIVRKYAQILDPPPVRVMAFFDVNEDSIDSGEFGFHHAGNDSWNWEHLPTDRHNQAANLGYADGHAERHQWKWPKAWRQFNQPPANALDQADLDDILEATPRR